MASKTPYNTPFKDAIGPSSVPTKGSKAGDYESPRVPDVPGRDGGLMSELYFDRAVPGAINGPGKPPSSSSLVKTVYKDAV